MSEWQLIETYDALDKKPQFAVFWIKEHKTNNHRDYTLKADVVTSRTFGSREVTHWMPIDPPSP